jgi:hypothetical protein
MGNVATFYYKIDPFIVYKSIDFNTTLTVDDLPDNKTFYKVFFSNGITALDNECFKNCVDLEIIESFNQITSLGDLCFYGCSNLKIIPDFQNITTLGNDCFSGCITIQSIPNLKNITTVGNACFSGCTNLKKIVDFGNLTTLSESCFANCINLSSVPSLKNIVLLSESCFFRCSFEKITLSYQITDLPNSCFYECTKLKSIIIPSNIISIQLVCFYGCSKLKSITFINPQNINFVGNNVFRNTMSKIKVIYNNSYNVNSLPEALQNSQSQFTNPRFIYKYPNFINSISTNLSKFNNKKQHRRIKQYIQNL